MVTLGRLIFTLKCISYQRVCWIEFIPYESNPKKIDYASGFEVYATSLLTFSNRISAVDVLVVLGWCQQWRPPVTDTSNNKCSAEIPTAKLTPALFYFLPPV